MLVISDTAAVAREWASAAWNQHDLDAAAALLAPDWVGHFAGLGDVYGHDGFKRVAREFLQAFPDMHIFVDDAVADGDKVVRRVSWSATHTGTFLGVPPSGRCVNASEMVILRILHGKIAELWDVADLLGLLQQLGAVPVFSLDGGPALETVKPAFAYPSGGGRTMNTAMAIEGAGTFEQAVANLRLATDRFVNGDNTDWKAMCSNQPDVSVAGRAGGFEVGWPEVEKRYDWVRDQYVAGDLSYETTNWYVAGNLGFILEIARGEILLKGKQAPEHIDVRITHILRREEGQWKLLHRHADNAMIRRPLASQPRLDGDQ
jgi:steroid delta-isomerase-like uncharacterized protein